MLALRECILGYLSHLAGGSGRPNPLAFGLVLSFYKQEKAAGLRERQGIWSDQLRGLFSILDDNPVFRRFVVGIDMAGRERGCPMWLFRDAVDRLRAWNYGHSVAGGRPGAPVPVARLSRQLGALGSGPPLDRASALFDALSDEPAPWRRLGLTVHAGEDFDDPMTGLRQLWEALVGLDLGRWDRIGHALAAALDPPMVRDLLHRRAEEPGRRAVRRVDDATFCVWKPRGEHMMDLAWERRLTSGARRVGTTARLTTTAARTWGTRDRVPELREHLSPDRVLGGPIEYPGLFFEDPLAVEEWHREWITLDEQWFDRFESCRQIVLSELIVREVVVESCPTSNRTVANLSTAPIDVFARIPDLKCVVATDDPGLFGGWPRDEIAQIPDYDDDRDRYRRRLLETAKNASFCWPTP